MPRMPKANERWITLLKGGINASRARYESIGRSSEICHFPGVYLRSVTDQNVSCVALGSGEQPTALKLVALFLDEANAIAIIVLHIHLAVAPRLIDRSSIDRNAFCSEFTMY